MAYSLGSGMWDGVFAVPNAAVDGCLKMASGLAAKVLLLLLRHGGRMDAAGMAEVLGYSVEDIADAVHYWAQSGLIVAEGAPGLEYAPVVEAPASAAGEAPPVREPAAVGAGAGNGAPPPEGEAPSPPEAGAASSGRRVETLSKSRPRLTTGEINEMADKDENIAHLLQEAQSVLGKTLTPVSTDVVVALYCYYEMQPDLILMLMHYCVSIGKDSLRYIEKVAADWLDKGIDSHEKAEAEIVRQTKRNTLENQVKRAFGIHDRNLVSSEKKYIHTWTEEYRQDLALITLAYERAVELTGKLSFAYINGILKNWHGNGITTTVQAMQDIRENRPAAKKKGGETGSSYDIGELEDLITYGKIG